MPTLFPGSLDSFTNPQSTDPLNSPSHSEQHTDINDAMEAVQSYLLEVEQLGTGAQMRTMREKLGDVLAVADYDTAVNASAAAVANNRYLTGVTSQLEITVGSGGQCATINDALRAASRFLQEFNGCVNTENASQVTIRLLTGFVMAEQVLVTNMDLGRIVITADDAEVTIQRSALTMLHNARYAAFSAYEGATLPVIGALFNMDTSGSASLRDGVFVSHCSRAALRAGAGVKNAGERGLHVSNGSVVNARATVFSGATTIGVRVANGSWLACRNIDARDAAGTGMAIDTGSHVDAGHSNFSGAGTYGVTVDHGSSVNLLDSNLSASGNDGLRVRFGSRANARGANISSSGNIAVYGFDADVIVVRSADLSAATGNAINAQEGSRVLAMYATCSGAGSSAVVAQNGSQINVDNADCSGSGGAGVYALQGSHINAVGANCQSGGAPVNGDIRVATGSTIAASGATGGLWQTANTITSSGIIFQ